MVAPILKWAGGKRWLVATGKLPAPGSITRYVEPFLGSGAVFFHLRPAAAILSDINPDLMNFYEVLRSRPDELRVAMEEHQAAHGKSYYYQIRERVPESQVERAARFLYLNRTCWNGLYRVNRRGQFNVPIGTKQAVVMATDDFNMSADILGRAQLRCVDFEVVIDDCKAGDFVFVDPPYTAKHNLNGFLKYNERIFGWEDQVRLHAALRRAGDRGAQICVTNADHASLRSLYEDFESTSLARKSILAANANARGETTEALLTMNI